MNTSTEQKECKLFYWLPTLCVFDYVKGYDIAFCWGYLYIVLWNSIDKKFRGRVKNV